MPAYLGGETSGEGSSNSLGTPYARLREQPDTRVLGTEFYDTIRRLPRLSALYDRGESGAFDIQRLGRVGPLVGHWLSALHTGSLLTYVSWILWGLAVLLVVVALAM